MKFYVINKKKIEKAGEFSGLFKFWILFAFRATAIILKRFA